MEAFTTVRWCILRPRTSLHDLAFLKTLTPNTVLRGGYGIVYVQFNRAGGENNLTYNGPDVVNATVNNNNSVYPTPSSLCTNDTQVQTNCFRQTQQGYSNILTSPAYFNPLNVTSRYIDPNFKTGYVQSYFLGVQRQLPGGFCLMSRTSATRARTCKSWRITTRRRLPRGNIELPAPPIKVVGRYRPSATLRSLTAAVRPISTHCRSRVRSGGAHSMC